MQFLKDFAKKFICINGLDKDIFYMRSGCSSTALVKK